MEKKKVRVKFVDIPQIENKQDSFGNICEYDYDSELILEALRRNYIVEISDEPDIVICWYVNNTSSGIEYDSYDCIRIQMMTESAWPDMNCYDYVISGHYNLGIKNRSFFLPASLFAGDFLSREFQRTTTKCYEKALHKHEHITDDLVNRDFCSFTVSNGSNCDPEREAFFYKLSEYKRVDSGGRFLNNIGAPVKDKLEFDAQHKFSITFENFQPSFPTEKIDMAFAAGTIPIYWGSPYIGEIYNEKAFINCYNYNSFDEVIERVKEIDNNDELYLQMLREPAFKNPKSVEEWKDELAEFMRQIVETPVNLAINRSNNCTSKDCQSIRKYGITVFQRRQKVKNMMFGVLGKFFSPWRNSSLAKWVKRRLYSM